VLEVFNVSKVYSQSGVKALDSVSLSIADQEIVGFLGPNGAGKTTLVKIIAGLVIPSGGEVTIAGFDVQRRRYAALRHLGVVLEGARNLYWPLSVRDNILYFGAIKGISAGAIRHRLPELLKLLQLEGFADRKVGSLSSGQKQRAAIATALVHDPSVLILDEPTNGLDIPSVDNFIDVLQTLCSQKRVTMLVSSHNLGFVQEVVSSTIFIDKGRLIGTLSINELKSFPQGEHYVLTLEEDSAFDLSRTKDLFPGTTVHFDPIKDTLLVNVRPSESLSDYLSAILDIGIKIRSAERLDSSLENVYRQLLRSESKE